MIRRRRLLRTGAAIPFIALAGARPAAAATVDEALTKAAQKEGTLTYYFATSADITARWNAAFTRKYGISIKNVRGPTYPLFDRWQNEERVGKHIADVICFTDPSIVEGANKHGLIADYRPAEAAALPSTMKQDGVWYATTIAYMGVGWNTKLVSAEEERLLLQRQWDVLADPRWQGRYTTTAAASGGSTYAYWYMLVNALRDRYGVPFLHKLAANKPGIFISKPPMYDRLVAGEYAIADQASMDLMGDLYLQGAPFAGCIPIQYRPRSPRTAYRPARRIPMPHGSFRSGRSAQKGRPSGKNTHPCCRRARTSPMNARRLTRTGTPRLGSPSQRRSISIT